METRVILVVGSILLCCACLGLVIVRLTNPFLKGLGWLGGSFGAGALGAGILTVRADAFADSSMLAAYTSLLLAYVLLHVCILELTESKSLLPTFGFVLLAIQAAAYPVFRYVHNVTQLCIVALGVLLAVQALQTVALLKKATNTGIRAPAWLSIALLVGFAAFNLFRSAAVLALGIPQDSRLPNPFEAASAIVFLGTGLGIGFTVFWMTSTQIRLTLEELANTDGLTGIYNRRFFLSACERELLRSSRTGESFSLIMVDVDRFKKINDSDGHDTGDAVLCAVVEKLRHAVRNIDTLARWGGEEFVALLPGVGAGAALLIAQRLRRNVESLSVSSFQMSSSSLGTTIPVTISLGVATYIGPSDTVDDLFRRCDQAMYQAKAEGRNRVGFLVPEQEVLFPHA
jgi:diguanylate cyclase (GGDEF)-like protein